MISPRSNFYVYVYFRPDTGEPCYVGKGQGNRYLNHLVYSDNKHLTRIINKYGLPPIIKVSCNLTEDKAFQTEIALIAAIGREPLGPLVNMTDGGEGIPGFRWSEEGKKKQGAQLQSPENCRKRIAAIQRQETRNKIRESNREHLTRLRSDPEMVKRMVAGMHSPEGRRKQLEWLRGYNAGRIK